MSRKGFAKNTPGTRESREENARSLTDDPRFRALNATDRRHMKALLNWHNPLTGYLGHRTRALNLMKVLDVSEETLRRSRLRLIAAGLIVSYNPGTGHEASTYCIARSWAEADEAAALRLLPDAPHFPALVDDTPSAVNHRGVPAAAAEEDQEQEETPEERAAAVEEAREELGRARRRRGVRGAVPPELPLPDRGVQAPLVAEIDKRRADIEHQSDTNERGRTSLREAYNQTRRVPTASGAA